MTPSNLMTIFAGLMVNLKSFWFGAEFCPIADCTSSKKRRMA